MKRKHTKRVRRIAPRPRNAPKPLDDGMQHFLVSVPRVSPSVDQAMREQVASAIEAPEPRFTEVVEAAHVVPPPRLAPDPDAVAASMQRLHEKLGIASPDDIEPHSPPPDYGAWFQPIDRGEATAADARPNDYSWCGAALIILGWAAAIFLSCVLAGFSLVTGVRGALRWWMG
jgi:hypothetical protein